MKKRTLLCTTIAGAMIITGMSLPKVKADESAVINAIEQRFATSDYLLQSKKKSIVVELKAGTKLTKSDVKKIVETKYGKEGIVKSIVSRDGTEVVEDTGAVGTGAEVTLVTGKKFTVVLFGDVTGDGQINNLDAQTVLDEYFTGEKIKTEEAKKAADVTREKITNIDAQQILDYYFTTSVLGKDYGTDGSYVDESKLPTDKNINDEEFATLLNIKGEKKVGTDANENLSAIKNVKTELKTEDTGITTEVTVEAEVSKVQDVEGPNRTEMVERDTGSTNEPWYKIKLNTGIQDWKITDLDENAQYTTGADNQPELWLKLNEEEAIKLKVGNEKDPNEEMTVNINVKDVEAPILSKAENVTEVTGSEDEQRNQSQIKNEADGELYDTRKHEMTVKMNNNAMVAYERGGETKKWYELKLTTQMAAKKLTALEVLDNGETKELSQDRIKVVDDNKLILWLDGDKLETKIKLVNKNCVEEQKQAAQVITVKITPETEMGLKDVFIAPSQNTTSGNQKDNQDKVMTTMKGNTTGVTRELNDNSNEKEDYNYTEITIKAPVNELKEYGLDIGKTYGIKSNAQADEKEKYIGLVINTGYDVSKLNVSETKHATVALIKDDTNSLKTKFVTALSSGGGDVNTNYTADNAIAKEMLVFVDADELKKEEAEITLKTTPEAGTVENKKYEETLTFKIKLEDYSKPQQIKTLTKANNIEVEEAYREKYENNEHATIEIPVGTSTDSFKTTSTFKPKVRIAGIKEFGSDVEGGKDGGWYAVYVDTGADRNVLAVRYPGDYRIEYGADQELGEGVADDELLIWVDGSKTEKQIYEIYNIHDPSKTYGLVIENTDNSDLLISSLAKISMSSTDKNRIISDVLNGSNDYYTALSNNLNCLATSSAFTKETDVLTEEPLTYKIKINVNALDNVKIKKNEEGHWIGVILTLKNNSRIIESEFVDKVDGAILGATGITKAVAWVNLDEIVAAGEDGKAYEIKTSPDENGVEEKVTLVLKVDDISNIKGLDTTQAVKEANKPAWTPTESNAEENPLSDDTNAKDPFAFNMGLIKGVDVINANTIKVRVDLNKMKKFGIQSVATGTPHKYFALFMDVGVNATQLYADARCSTQVTKPDSKWKDADSQKSGAEASNQFIKWIGLDYEDSVQWAEGQQIPFTTYVYKRDTTTNNVIEKVAINIIIQQES